jgi:hypothetical protein
MVAAAVLVIGIAVVISGVVYFASPREPTYEGKTLSEWIAPFCRQTAKGLDEPAGPQHFQELEPVRNAVRQIGTNAVPFLIAQLNHRESALHREVRKLLEKQSHLALRLGDPNVSKIRAVRALAILGTDARPAIQSLTAQLTNAAVSLHAVYALSGMGAEGMRALIGQYTNVPPPCRMQIAIAVVAPDNIYRGPGMVVTVGGKYESLVTEANRQQTNEISADVLMEGFCEIAKDRTSMFQAPAIQRLGQYGPLASNAVPILMQVLEQHHSMTLQSTILALGKIRSQPEVVVPALTNLLSDPDIRIQMSAASALREFGYDGPLQSQVPRVIHPPPPVRPKERYY